MVVGPDMETHAFALKLRPGCESEYRRRHDEIWPDMQRMLLDSGILHYEIYLEPASGLLFGHIVRRRDHSMANSHLLAVTQRWNAHMADILEQDGGSAVRLPLQRMFVLQSTDTN